MERHRFNRIHCPTHTPLKQKIGRARESYATLPDLSGIRIDPIALKQMRLERDYTLEQVALSVGLGSRQQLHNIEAGIANPTGNVLLRLLLLYICDPADVVQTVTLKEQSSPANAQKILPDKVSNG